MYDLDEGAEVITERISLLEEVQEEYEGQAQYGNILSEAGVLREQGGMQPEIQRHTEEATLRRAEETTGSQGKKKNGGNVEPGIGQPQYWVRMRDNEVTTAGKIQQSMLLQGLTGAIEIYRARLDGEMSSW